MDTSRAHDIVLHGATGFVGALVAAHLAEHAPPGVRIALSGRSREKLERTRAELPEGGDAAARLHFDHPSSLHGVARYRMWLRAGTRVPCRYPGIARDLDHRSALPLRDDARLVAGCGSSGVTVSVPVGGRDLGDGSGVGSAGFGV